MFLFWRLTPIFVNTGRMLYICCLNIDYAERRKFMRDYNTMLLVVFIIYLTEDQSVNI